jgi:hypothetical protein
MPVTRSAARGGGTQHVRRRVRSARQAYPDLLGGPACCCYPAQDFEGSEGQEGVDPRTCELLHLADNAHMSSQPASTVAKRDVVGCMSFSSRYYLLCSSPLP